MTGKARAEGNDAAAQGHDAAAQARDSTTLEVAVRAGLLGYGLVHLLIGWTALQLAWTGGGSGSADQTGALRQLVDQPLGRGLLWAVAVGLVALAVWQAIEAVIGHTREDGAKRVAKRVGSAGRVVIYGVLAVSAANVARGESSGGGNNEESTSGRVMNMTGGQLIVGAVGLGVIAVGVYLVFKGVTTRFEKDLSAQATSGRSGSTVQRLGQVGYAAKGVSLALVGGLFTYAAATHDPQKAGGLDDALATLLEQPYGKYLLTLVALGLVSFGLFCFAWARWPDTTT